MHLFYLQQNSLTFILVFFSAPLPPISNFAQLYHDKNSILERFPMKSRIFIPNNRMQLLITSLADKAFQSQQKMRHQKVRRKQKQCLILKMREESSRLGGHLMDLVSVFSQLMTKTSFITIISSQVQHSSGQASKTKSAHGDLRGGRKWKK